MKMTIEKFWEKVSDEEALKAKIKAEISELMAREMKLSEEMETAANAGDAQLYHRLRMEKEEVSSTIFVKRRFSDKMASSVTEADARAAWENYAAGYNAKLKKALAEYREQREKLFSLYSGLVDLQAEACDVRESLGKVVGAAFDSFKMDTIPTVSGVDEKGQLRLGGFPGVDPDACFYLAIHARNTGKHLVPLAGNEDPELAKVRSVLLSHRVHTPYFNMPG